MTVKTMEGTEKRLEIYPECHWCADNVGRLALWGNIGLFAIKLLCGIEGDSKAVVADAVHSGVDVLMAIVLMICLRVSKSPPDEEHPYGHSQVEYVSSLFIGISLTAVVALIFYDCVTDIIRGVTHEPSMIALLGVIISIAGNELMFRHFYCCGTRFASPAMIANAWENRADVYSSLAALVGVVGALLGLLFMDRVGAILVAILIGRCALEMLRDAWHGILDHSLDESIENQIRKEANAHPDVRGVASLQTRAIGTHRIVDLKVGVSPDLTLHEGYEIADRVKGALMEKIDKVGLMNVSPVGFY